MIWISGLLCLHKEKQDANIRKNLNTISKTQINKKNKSKKCLGLLCCSSNTKRSKILVFLFGTLNLERREGGFLDHMSLL